MGCKPIFLFCPFAVFAVVPSICRDQCFFIVRVVFQQFAVFGASVCHGVDFVDIIPCADAVIACHPEFHISSSFLCPCLVACFFILLFYYIFILFSSLFCDFTHFSRLCLIFRFPFRFHRRHAACGGVSLHSVGRISIVALLVGWYPYARRHLPGASGMYNPRKNRVATSYAIFVIL